MYIIELYQYSIM